MKKFRKASLLILMSLFAVLIFGGAPSAYAACSGSVSFTDMTVTGNTVSVIPNNDSNEGLYVCLYYGQRANGEVNLPVVTTAYTVANGRGEPIKWDLKSSDYIGSAFHAVMVRDRTSCNAEYKNLGNNAVCDQTVQDVPAGTGTTGAGGDDKGNGGTTTNPSFTSGNMTTVDIPNLIGATSFTQLVQNILKWMLGMAGSVALLMLIYGGVIYITSTGDQTKAQQGKKIVTWTIAGLFVILMSYSFILVLDEIFTKTN
jgi:hypothetical protein